MYGTQNRSVDELIQRINGGAFFLTYEKNQRMGDLIQEIIREFRDQKEFYLESVKGYLLALLFEIARLQEDKKDTRHLLNSKDTSQIEPALTYVQEHYAESIKIQELAEQCSLSETHFRRIFEKKLQISPVDYINQIRIHKACLLLRDTYSSIEEIAMKTGFISMSTFNRNFRKLLGTSPKQWRKEMEDNGGSIKKYVISVEHGWE
jgi:transcriptional regulator GlxA family with amidase domain